MPASKLATATDAAFVILWQPVYQVGMRDDLSGYLVDPVAQSQYWLIAEG